MLNAFRHHGLYRPRDVRANADAIGRVLNAFRHHGLYRWLPVATMDTPPDVCSTPFGITDYIGFGFGRMSPAKIGAQRLSASRIISVGHTRSICTSITCVLNAFRHHGLYRWLPVATMDTPPDVCSTPFGITDYIGFGFGRMSPAKIGAQRLSASRIISVGHTRSICTSITCVLNAFRHHGLYRHASSAISDTRRRGAQRLSASRIISAPFVLGGSSLGDMCSTPFGITDYIGREQIERLRRHAGVLNAFRHHGLYRT